MKHQKPAELCPSFPGDPESIRVEKPKQVAGGLPAIWSSLRFTVKSMGITRGSCGLSQLNQKSGFDCPGCAWPDPDGKRSLTEFCENGAKAVAEEATRKSIGRDFFRTHTLEYLRQQPEHWLSQQGRLAEPLLYETGMKTYQPVSWNDALNLIVQSLKRCAPEEAVFYTSGRTSNEAAFLYQLLARKLGTNNLPDCSNLCHESSGAAMMESLGTGKGTVTLEDFQKADCIIVCGQNPGTNHPRMLTALQEAVRNGCQVVSVNPLRETGLEAFTHPQEPWKFVGKPERISSLHLPVRPGGDGTLFQALNQELFRRDKEEQGKVLDHSFIRQHCTGFQEYRDHVLNLDQDLLLKHAGISIEQLKTLAGLVCRSQRIICCWAMGLTQQTEGVRIIQEVLNFLLLRGNMGREGSGACPVRGHSNVQGDRTMGIWEKPSPSFLKALGKTFTFTPPEQHGYDVVESIRAMSQGKIRFFMAMGGNFVSAAPDTHVTSTAMSHCRLTVHVSTKLNRSHLYTGQKALILPCLSRSDYDKDRFITVENSMGIISRSRGSLPPVSRSLMSEPEIVAGIGARLWPTDEPKIPWTEMAEDYSLIRDKISQTIPGFDDFNGRLEREASFRLPHLVRDRRKFLTRTSKAQFIVSQFSMDPDFNDPDSFYMMTIRSHDQYNTTVYGLADRYRGIFGGRKVVFMNKEDMAKAGLIPYQQVALSSTGTAPPVELISFQVVPYEIPGGFVATYFPETNPLIPLSHVAAKSNTPASKKVKIRITSMPAG